MSWSDGVRLNLCWNGPQGKTVQVISLVYVYLTARIGKHVLILAPVNTLQNWIAEFDKVSGRSAVCPPRCAVSVGPAVMRLHRSDPLHTRIWPFPTRLASTSLSG